MWYILENKHYPNSINPKYHVQISSRKDFANGLRTNGSFWKVIEQKETEKEIDEAILKLCVKDLKH